MYIKAPHITILNNFPLQHYEETWNIQNICTKEIGSFSFFLFPIYIHLSIHLDSHYRENNCICIRYISCSEVDFLIGLLQSSSEQHFQRLPMRPHYYPVVHSRSTTGRDAAPFHCPLQLTFVTKSPTIPVTIYDVEGEDQEKWAVRMEGEEDRETILYFCDS